WVPRGERHLHGAGACYACTVCKKSVTIAHRLGCAMCKNCKEGYYPFYFFPQYASQEQCPARPCRSHTGKALCRDCGQIMDGCRCSSRAKCRSCKKQGK